jgi:hypothetical protein
MMGFGISGGETSGSSFRKPVIYYDGQLEKTRSRGREVDGTRSESCAMLGFGNSRFEISSSAIRVSELVRWI